MVRKTTRAKKVPKSKTLSRNSNIKHCYSCKEGRLIRHKELIFCGFCGKEFKRVEF